MVMNKRSHASQLLVCNVASVFLSSSVSNLLWSSRFPSQENFLTPSVFGEIIYENFLFDIPKILDLCVLFGKGNTQLLYKMIGRLLAF